MELNDQVEGGDEPTGAEHGIDPISCSWGTGAGGSTSCAVAT
jgi:hypothetical protein